MPPVAQPHPTTSFEDASMKNLAWGHRESKVASKQNSEKDVPETVSFSTRKKKKVFWKKASSERDELSTITMGTVMPYLSSDSESSNTTSQKQEDDDGCPSDEEQDEILLTQIEDKTRTSWKATVDAITGRKYYYNRSTRETTWTKPPGFIERETVANHAKKETKRNKSKQVRFDSVMNRAKSSNLSFSDMDTVSDAHGYDSPEERQSRSPFASTESDNFLQESPSHERITDLLQDDVTSFCPTYGNPFDIYGGKNPDIMLSILEKHANEEKPSLHGIQKDMIDLMASSTKEAMGIVCHHQKHNISNDSYSSTPIPEEEIESYSTFEVQPAASAQTPGPRRPRLTRLFKSQRKSRSGQDGDSGRLAFSEIVHRDCILETIEENRDDSEMSVQETSTLCEKDLSSSPTDNAEAAVESVMAVQTLSLEADASDARGEDKVEHDMELEETKQIKDGKDKRLNRRGSKSKVNYFVRSVRNINSKRHFLKNAKKVSETSKENRKDSADDTLESKKHFVKQDVDEHEAKGVVKGAVEEGTTAETNKNVQHPPADDIESSNKREESEEATAAQWSSFQDLIKNGSLRFLSPASDKSDAENEDVASPEKSSNDFSQRKTADGSQTGRNSMPEQSLDKSIDVDDKVTDGQTKKDENRSDKASFLSRARSGKNSDGKREKIVFESYGDAFEIALEETSEGASRSKKKPSKSSRRLSLFSRSVARFKKQKSTGTVGVQSDGDAFEMCHESEKERREDMGAENTFPIDSTPPMSSDLPADIPINEYTADTKHVGEIESGKEKGDSASATDICDNKKDSRDSANTSVPFGKSATNTSSVTAFGVERTLSDELNKLNLTKDSHGDQPGSSLEKDDTLISGLALSIQSMMWSSTLGHDSEDQKDFVESEGEEVTITEFAEEQETTEAPNAGPKSDERPRRNLMRNRGKLWKSQHFRSNRNQDEHGASSSSKPKKSMSLKGIFEKRDAPKHHEEEKSVTNLKEPHKPLENKQSGNVRAGVRKAASFFKKTPEATRKSNKSASNHSDQPEHGKTESIPEKSSDEVPNLEDEQDESDPNQEHTTKRKRSFRLPTSRSFTGLRKRVTSWKSNKTSEMADDDGELPPELDDDAKHESAETNEKHEPDQGKEASDKDAQDKDSNDAHVGRENSLLKILCELSEVAREISGIDYSSDDSSEGGSYEHYDYGHYDTDTHATRSTASGIYQSFSMGSYFSKESSYTTAEDSRRQQHSTGRLTPRDKQPISQDLSRTMSSFDSAGSISRTTNPEVPPHKEVNDNGPPYNKTSPGTPPRSSPNSAGSLPEAQVSVPRSQQPEAPILITRSSPEAPSPVVLSSPETGNPVEVLSGEVEQQYVAPANDVVESDVETTIDELIRELEADIHEGQHLLTDEEEDEEDELDSRNRSPFAALQTIPSRQSDDHSSFVYMYMDEEVPIVSSNTGKKTNVEDIFRRATDNDIDNKSSYSLEEWSVGQ